LGVDRVGIHDSFFDLGGHSLIAVRLFAKIKKALRVDYPISVLFEAPTIVQFAELIRSTGADLGAKGRESVAPHTTRFTHLVAMHPAPSKEAEKKAPFFLVAGMFGNVLNLRHLAHLVGQDRRFYGLQARGLYGDHTPHETFEAMANDYLSEVRAVQRKGPYLLGGFSGGGITAYEMARQLVESGEEVALLVLLDTPLPSCPTLTGRDRLMLHVKRFRQEGAGHFVEWVKGRYAWEANWRRRRTNGHDKKGGSRRPFDFHSEEIESAFRRALDRYVLTRLPLAITLFRPPLDMHAVLGPGRIISRERRFIFHDNGWGPYAPRVDVFEVPGDHDSMVLEPNVRVLSMRLRECIAQAEAAPRPCERLLPTAPSAGLAGSPQRRAAPREASGALPGSL
jgi:thioesterase domain-containing protein/acyl carrier protein